MIVIYLLIYLFLSLNYCTSKNDFFLIKNVFIESNMNLI